MVLISKGDFLWIESPTSLAPIGARVVGEYRSDVGDEGVVVIDDDGNEHELGAEARIRLMHPSSVQGEEDLVTLGDLHEAAILRNFHMRYRQKLIYSRVGSILYAVNPYRSLPSHSQEQMHSYAHGAGGIDAMPPHILDTANRALRRALSTGDSQCIVLTGESGAGKSTSSRYVTEFLHYALQRSTSHAPGKCQQVSDMHTVLEAFGNATTTLNCNSSRHGKLIGMTLHQPSSTLMSTRIETFALEKTRVSAIRTGGK